MFSPMFFQCDKECCPSCGECGFNYSWYKMTGKHAQILISGKMGREAPHRQHAGRERGAGIAERGRKKSRTAIFDHAVLDHAEGVHCI